MSFGVDLFFLRGHQSGYLPLLRPLRNTTHTIEPSARGSDLLAGHAALQIRGEEETGKGGKQAESDHGQASRSLNETRSSSTMGLSCGR